MKTWVTYLAALVLGCATAFAFSSSLTLMNVMSYISTGILELYVLVFLFTTFLTLTSGTATLKKEKRFGKTLGKTILWSIISTAVLALSAVSILSLYQQSHPVTTTTGMEVQGAMSTYAHAFSPFYILFVVEKILLFLIIVSWVFGFSITPKKDKLKPSYDAFSSMSEACYKIQKVLAGLGCFVVYTSSTSLFMKIIQDGTIITSFKSFGVLALGLVAVIFVILPLLFYVFTLFRKNPYKVIFKSFSAVAMGFATSNIYATTLVNESVSEVSLKTKRETSSSVMPLNILLTRGGSAFISTIATISLLWAIGAPVGKEVLLLVALLSFAFSFLSSLAPGMEVVLISYAIFRFLKVDGSLASTIIAFLPLVNGFAVMLDTILSALCVSICEKKEKKNVEEGENEQQE